jgi:CHAT domain-containing protein
MCKGPGFFLFFLFPLIGWNQQPLSAIQNNVFDLLDQNNMSGALQEARSMVVEAEKSSTKNDVWYAHSYFTLGTVEGIEDQHDSSEAHLLYAISCYERLSYYDAEYIDACRNVSLLFDKQGQNKEVIAYTLKIAPLLEKQFGAASMDVGNTCFTLGLAFYKTGDYPQSKLFLIKAKKAFETSAGKNNLKTLRTLVNLGVLFQEMSLTLESKSYFETAKQGLEAIGKTNTGEYITALNGLMVAHGEALDIQNVENASVKLEEIFNLLGLLTSETYVDFLNSYAAALKKCGNLVKAELNFFRAKKTLDLHHPTDTLRVAGWNEAMGNLQLEMHNTSEGLRYLKVARTLYTKVLGVNHPKTMNCLMNLSLAFEHEPYSEEASGIYEGLLSGSVVQQNAYLHTTVVNNYSLFLAKNQRFQEAKELMQKARNVFELKGDTLNPYYGKLLAATGILEWRSGNLSDAKKGLAKGISHLSEGGSVNANELLDFKLEYANLLAQNGEYAAAIDSLNGLKSEKTQAILSQLYFMDQAQMATYWKMEEVLANDVFRLSSHVGNEYPNAQALAYDMAVSSKGLLLETQLNRSLGQKKQTNPAPNALYDQWVDLNAQRTKMESDGTADLAALDELKKRLFSVEKQLAQQQSGTVSSSDVLNVSWQGVHYALREGEAAVEFVRFFDKRDSSYRYNALVLRHDVSAPQLVRLCTEKQLAAIAPKSGFSSLYPLVWEPIDSLLSNIRTVYYAPVGVLSNVPFHALYKAKNEGDLLTAAVTNKRGVTVGEEATSSENGAEYLLDRYTLHQLSSTRWLALGLREKTETPLQPSIALVGGVDYDMLPGKNAPTSEKAIKSKGKRSSESVSGRLAYLEGTKTEVEAIQQVLASQQWKVMTLTQAEATEEKVLDLLEKTKTGVLHLATHGYAFPEVNFRDTSRSERSLKYSFRYSQNPMVRSGVILSGGNWAWTGSDNLSKLGAKQNGILTALEVSQLNLSDTKLVVLSACETGLGKIEGSEGTFGLTRGFKLAGVEQLIVSLWSVPDKETMELMTAFYGELAKTNTATKAFANAQKVMRTKYPNRPDLWAGFVLVR